MALLSCLELHLDGRIFIVQQPVVNGWGPSQKAMTLVRCLLEPRQTLKEPRAEGYVPIALLISSYFPASPFPCILQIGMAM